MDRIQPNLTFLISTSHVSTHRCPNHYVWFSSYWATWQRHFWFPSWPWNQLFLYQLYVRTIHCTCTGRSNLNAMFSEIEKICFYYIRIVQFWLLLMEVINIFHHCCFLSFLLFLLSKFSFCFCFTFKHVSIYTYWLAIYPLTF